MGAKDEMEEVGLSEIASILGCSRATAYIRTRSGEIEGSRLVAGRLWIAPRSSVLRYREAMLNKAAAIFYDRVDWEIATTAGADSEAASDGA